LNGCWGDDSIASCHSVRNFVIALTNGLLLLTLKMRILLNLFSARMPEFVRNSRCRAAEV